MHSIQETSYQKTSLHQYLPPFFLTKKQVG